MSMKAVKVHKMYQEFHRFPPMQFMGEYDESNQLVSLVNSFHQHLSRISGTYQWALAGSNEVYFIEEDPMFRRDLD